MKNALSVWRVQHRCAIVVACVFAALGFVHSVAMAAPDFRADVLPILQKHCFECHGPEARQGGLRMTSPALALEGGDSLRSLYVPGKSDASFLIERVTAENPVDRMPPVGPGLSADEIATLRAWIDGGASWGDTTGLVVMAPPRHWAYQPPVQRELPEHPFSEWAQNPIDAFVAAKFVDLGLEPSPRADRATLLRRLYLDLTGLPPTPEELVAFLEDDAPDAYDRVVETLLASPHFGEKQALDWLDGARYADTNGYEKDRPRSIWPYRDWVIAAYNNGMAFDRFVRAQIAGDLFPGATAADHVATGFLRNSMWNEEGGVDVEEFRYEALVDRTNTVSTVFLGLTMECAQCHTHKYDDLTQREYFQLFSFLNSTDDIEMALHDENIARERAKIAAQADRIEERLARDFPAGPNGEESADHLEQRLEEWLQAQESMARDWSVARPIAMHSENRATLNALEDGSILVSGDWPNTDRYDIEVFTPLNRITAIRIEAMPDPSLPGGGPGRGIIMSDDGDFLLSEIGGEALPWRGDGATVPLFFTGASESFAAEGRAAALALDGKLDTGWSIKGRSGENHWAVFDLAEAVGHEGGTRLRLSIDQFYVHQHTLGRFRIWVTNATDDLVAHELAPELEAIAAVPAALRSASDTEALRRHFLQTAPELEEQHKKLAALRKRMPDFPKSLVVRERMEPRQTPIYHRGEYLSPKGAVEPGVPAVLHPYPEHLPPTRLGFAQWLTAPENPLLARVIVNRLWQQYFGKGIVASAEDFGVRGDVPTHPEMLDWLAVEFMARGWHIKDVVRLIVHSATYQQDSRVRPGDLEKDPQNDWLARAPRFRVGAEVVRDIALASSGMIHRPVGGPSIYPPIPDGVLNLTFGGGGDWPETTGADRYRRGLYVYWKRTAPFPGLTVFDAPAGDVACVRRTRSNTPLQALTLLNDQVFLEAAQGLARRVLQEAGPDDAARLRYLYMRSVARPPRPEEATAMTAFLNEQRERYGSNDAGTTALLEAANLGDDYPAAKAELAAWTLLARAILNLDETITRR